MKRAAHAIASKHAHRYRVQALFKGSRDDTHSTVHHTITYHATVLSRWDADRTSMSPSRSMSLAYTSYAPSAMVVMFRMVKVGGEPPSLSYHRIQSEL